MVLAKFNHYIKTVFLAGLALTCPPEQKAIAIILALFAYLVDRHLYAIRADLQKLHPRHKPRQKKPDQLEGAVASTTKKND